MVVLTLVGDGPAAAQAPVSGTRQTRPLFRIERSKNANIVQYDVQLSPEGRLDPKEPVIAYWIRCAEDGRKQELTALQRTWYYGFKATYDPRSDSALMEMEAKNLRPIRIHEVEGAYRGETIIDGQPAFLDRMFVTSVPSGVMRKVTSIELYGQDTKTGLNRYEKIMP